MGDRSASAALSLESMIPARAGCYVVILELGRRRRIRVGALGELVFAPGFYLYTGSAFGPGGLRARLRRHVQGSGRRHWHVDYLRDIARPVELWFQCQSSSREHVWAQALVSRSRRPVAGFGASDCGCASHLVHARRHPSAASLRACLQSPGEDALQRLPL